MVITSLQNQTIKDLVKLKNKKDRDATGRFLVEGHHLVQEAEKAGLLLALYVLEGDTKQYPIEPVYCSQHVLNKLSSQKSDAKVIAVCKKPIYPKQPYEKILLLEHIQDPGNIGTLVRSAYAFGAQAIIASKNCADFFAPKTIQSSQGALFHIPCMTADLETEIPALQQESVHVYAAALDSHANKLNDIQPSGKWAVIIGNEGKGISESVLKLADESLYIEMQDFESLNAAIAGSIVLYHFQFS